MAPAVLSRVIYGATRPEAWQIGSLQVRPAILYSYCRYQVNFVDYPGIVPETGKTVRGTYVEGLTEGDIWRLDIFEGDEYERRKVKVRILCERGEAGTEEIDTETYVYVSGRNKLKDEEWDFQEFVRSKLYRWVGESKEYSGTSYPRPVLIDKSPLTLRPCKELDEVDPLGGVGVRMDSTQPKGWKVGRS